MKTKTALSQNRLLIFGLPALLILSISILALNHRMVDTPAMAVAIILDLVLTIPLIYWLLIRSTDIPKITIVPMIIGGLVLTNFILPESQQILAGNFRHILIPIIELGVFFYLIRLAKKTGQKFKALKNRDTDFLEVIRKTVQEVFPMKTFAKFLSFEIAVFYYAFFLWSKPKTIAAHQFTYHKKSGAAALFYALTMIILVESFAVHLLIAPYSPVFAWLLTISSLYLAVQFYAHIKAIKRRLITIENEQIFFRNGLFANTLLPLNNIHAIELSQRQPQTDRKVEKFALIAELELHNIILHLKKPITIEGFYGVKKQAEVVLIWVDEKDKFVQQIQSYLD